MEATAWQKILGSSTGVLGIVGWLAGAASTKWLGWTPAEAATMVGVVLAPFGLKEAGRRISQGITNYHALKGVQEMPPATGAPTATPIGHGAIEPRPGGPQALSRGGFVSGGMSDGRTELTFGEGLQPSSASRLPIALAPSERIPYVCASGRGPEAFGFARTRTQGRP